MGVNLQSAAEVRELFLAATRANRTAACRQGSIDVIRPPGLLIATGDIHDNPVNFSRLVKVAGMDDRGSPISDRRSLSTDASTKVVPESISADPRSEIRDPRSPTHLVLHEIIHSDRLINGADFSYRALARVAELKVRFPERVHTLLANHELSQVVGAGIIKDGVRVVEAFNMGLEYAFGGDFESVASSINEFVKSMPLALRCICDRRDILCAHSLPSTAMMQRFDPTVLSRDLTEADYEPRKGAAHIMVWGRGYDAEQIEDLVERWGVSLFILGHEKAENGALLVPPSVIVLNSDTEKGAYLPIDLSRCPTPEESMGMVKLLAEVDAEGV